MSKKENVWKMWDYVSDLKSQLTVLRHSLEFVDDEVVEAKRKLKKLDKVLEKITA